MMKTYIGEVASKGITYGKLLYLKNRKQTEKYDSEYEHEKSRLNRALETSIAQLESLLSSSKAYLTEFELGIFEVQIQLLMDENIINSIDEKLMENKCNAEYAVELVLNEITERLGKIDDETVLTRIADVKDIFERVIDNLEDECSDDATRITGSVIVVAEELLPSTALNLDLSRIGGIITKHGSEKGHLAILARALNIPYLCGVEISGMRSNIMAIVDGYEAKVILDPDTETREFYVNKMARIFNENAIYSEMKGLDNTSKDGRKIDILCNIGLAEEVDSVILNDGAGVGLLRTEFLFMQEKEFPSEEKQYHYYSHIIKKMAGKKTVIRTLDIGEDKIPSYVDVDDWKGTANGINRGVTFSLNNPGIFKAQLRAIYRASANCIDENSSVSILFPMVRTEDDLRRCLELCEETEKELKNSQIPFNESVKKGIMVECVQAVENIDSLACISDFFSVGTNDLYRELTGRLKQQNCNESSDKKTKILEMIKEVADEAHKHNIRVTICGELASDMNYTEDFLNIGIDELSVNPSDVLKLRYKIRSL